MGLSSCWRIFSPTNKLVFERTGAPKTKAATDYIAAAFEANLKCGALFIDLDSAYDTNWHREASTQEPQTLKQSSSILHPVEQQAGQTIMAPQRVEKETTCWWIATNAANLYHTYWLLPEGVVPSEPSPGGCWALQRMHALLELGQHSSF